MSLVCFGEDLFASDGLSIVSTVCVFVIKLYGRCWGSVSLGTSSVELATSSFFLLVVFTCV